MRNLFMGLCGAGVAVVLAGCQPELAQTREGAREAQWRAMIGESYSGYRPPRTAPPAIKDNVSPELVEREQQMGNDGAEGDLAVPFPGEEIYYEEDLVLEEDAAPAPVDDAAAADSAAVDGAEDGAVDGSAAPAATDDAAAVTDEKATQEAGETVEYVVKAGDTLSHIAKKFYGKASFADLIWKANSKVVPNPNRLKPGTKLQIPKL